MTQTQGAVVHTQGHAPKEPEGLKPAQWAKARKVCEALEEGYLTPTACQKAGITRSTLYRWVDADDTLRDSLARARQAGADAMLEQAWEILDTAPVDDFARAREKAQHLRWVASKLMPNQAVGVNVNGTGRDDGGVQIVVAQGLGQADS